MKFKWEKRSKKRLYNRFRDLPIYLNGFPSFVNWFKQASTTLDVHELTLFCWYAFPPIVPSMASFIMLLTSSTTNAVLKHTNKQMNQEITKFKTASKQQIYLLGSILHVLIYNTLLIYNRIENTKSKSVEEQNILNDDEEEI